MIIETIRLSEQAKNQLIKIKRRTKIENWNTLCRWALCLSLADPKPVKDHEIKYNSSVEMTWKVFGGEYCDLFDALIKERCDQDGIELSKKNLTKQLKLHIHRGISYMDTNPPINDIRSFITLTSFKDEPL
jgi:DNA sulfur modification protein DndE